MIGRTHRVNRRIRAAAFQLVETLESRIFLSSIGGILLGSPIVTSAAANGLSPLQVNCADFGNGKDDVYVANQNDTISVLMSNGDGTFQTPVASYAVAGAPRPLATGRFTSSGNVDIVTGTTGASGAQGDVSILLGNGNGTFQPAINIPALQSNRALAVGRFVTGGPLDILSVSNSESNANNVCLTITDGTGHLASQTFFSTPFGYVSSVAVGNFGNGHEDFAICNQANNSVTVYFGNGNGTFQAPETFATGPAPTSIVAGTFDASGNVGLVTADSTGGEVSFLANNGNGTFAAPVNSPVAGSVNGGGPRSLRVGQFVSSSEQDIVCLLTPGSSADATILLGNGDGTFRTGTTVTTGGANAVAVGDLAGNGLTDLVVGSGSQISVLLKSPATQLAFVQSPSSATAGSSINPAITVQAETAGGSLVSSYNSNVTISIASGPAGAALGGWVTVKAVNGVATFSNLTLTEAGTYRFEATYRTVLLSVPSSSFAITAAAPAKLAFRHQPQNTTAGAIIDQSAGYVTVAVEDTYGNVCKTYLSNVTIGIASGPAGAVLGGWLTVKATGGVALFSNLTLNEAGNYTLSASHKTLTGAPSNSFTISAAAGARAAMFADAPILPATMDDDALIKMLDLDSQGVLSS